MYQIRIKTGEFNSYLFKIDNFSESIFNDNQIVLHIKKESINMIEALKIAKEIRAEYEFDAEENMIYLVVEAERVMSFK